MSSSQWERYQELTETSDNPALQGKPWPPCTCGKCPALNGSATGSWQRPAITRHCKVRKPWPPCTCGKCPVLNESATRSSQRPAITPHCKVLELFITLLQEWNCRDLKNDRRGIVRMCYCMLKWQERNCPDTGWSHIHICPCPDMLKWQKGSCLHMLNWRKGNCPHMLKWWEGHCLDTGWAAYRFALVWVSVVSFESRKTQKVAVLEPYC